MARAISRMTPICASCSAVDAQRPAAFFSTSSMRACHLGPSDLKRSTTSRVKRSETATLGGSSCGSRARRFFVISGKALANGLARRKSRTVHSRLSGSAAIPAWMRASSAAVSAPTAKRLSPQCRSSGVLLREIVGDHSHSDGRQSRSHSPSQRICICKVETVRGYIGLPLGLVPDDLHPSRIYELVANPQARMAKPNKREPNLCGLHLTHSRTRYPPPRGPREGPQPRCGGGGPRGAR
jgi:hypothetical protein